MMVIRKPVLLTGIPFEDVATGKVIRQADLPHAHLFIKLPDGRDRYNAARLDTGNTGIFQYDERVVVIEGAFVEGAE